MNATGAIGMQPPGHDLTELKAKRTSLEMELGKVNDNIARIERQLQRQHKVDRAAWMDQLPKNKPLCEFFSQDT